MSASSYPIGAAAKLTGLPLDTLRAWERRYRAVLPERTPRGRLYTEEQIKRLILLRQVVDQGHAIGRVAGLKDRELRALMDQGKSLAAANGAKAGNGEAMLAPILHAIERFDYAATDREINRLAAAVANPRNFVHEAALPLMRTIGERWHDGRCSIAQEHILSNLLSALLISMVRTYSPSNPLARVLLATPRGERHAFPNLAAAMLTAAGGLGVIYLGTDLPAADIVLAARKSAADVVLLSVSTAAGAEMREELQHIERKLHGPAALWLGGGEELRLDAAVAGSRWQVLHDFAALERRLGALGARF